MNKMKLMRMKGTTQSYYLYDSELYKNSKSALDDLKQALGDLRTS